MNYWLMKSEPDCYSIDDLERDGTEFWEGCRNYQVRNYLRDEMSPGDMAFFYHSSTKPAGIVGTMKITSEAYPDPTQFDPESRYFDAKSSRENPRWFVRDIQFDSKFKRMVTLQELKETPGLEKMWVTKKGQRISILPVTPEEWKIVLDLVN